MQLGITFEKLEWRVMNDGEYVPFWAMHHGYSNEPSLIMLIVLYYDCEQVDKMRWNTVQYIIVLNLLKLWQIQNMKT